MVGITMVGGAGGVRRMLLSPPRGKVLKHGLGMRGEHPLQATRHRIRPEEVVVQGNSRIHPPLRIDIQEFVDEIQGLLVLHVAPQAIFDLSLVTLREFQGVGEFKLLESRPNRGRDRPAEVTDERQLVLLRVALHDGTSRPHLRHDAARPPEVNRGSVVTLAQQQLRWAVPQRHDPVRVAVRRISLG